MRVAGRAASLNFNDIDRCRGKLVSVPTPPPYTLGMDVCGVVDAAGAGAEHWLGRRVVAITKTALGGIAEYAIAPAVSVFDAPPGARRRRGRRLPADVPHLAPRPVPPGQAAGRRDGGDPLGGERPRQRRHPAGQGRRGPGDRRGRRTGEGRAVPGARRRPGDRPHRRGLRRGRAGGDRRRRRRGGVRPHRRRRGRALVALHRPRGSLPRGRVRRRRRERHDRATAAHGLHRQHLDRRRDAGVGRGGRPRHAAVRLQPVRARRGRGGARRPAAARRRGPDPTGDRPRGCRWPRPARPSTSTSSADRSGARSSRSSDGARSSTRSATPTCTADRSRPSTRSGPSSGGSASSCRPCRPRASSPPR